LDANEFTGKSPSEYFGNLKDNCTISLSLSFHSILQSYVSCIREENDDLIIEKMVRKKLEIML
jgi:hypothetical protein